MFQATKLLANSLDQRSFPGYPESPAQRCPVRREPEAGACHGEPLRFSRSLAIADSAAGYAALSLLADGEEVLTVEFKLNLLAPAAGELLVARGRVLRAGRTLTVCEADVCAVDAGAETPCAVALTTMIRRPRLHSDE